MPPQANPTGPDAGGEAPAAAFRRLGILRKRADFLRASRSARHATQGFILQMRVREPGEAEGIRVGFTCSKKVGNAVARNRAKRRLREVARLTLPHLGRDDCDYVLIGRRDVTADMPFDTLTNDLARAISRLHGSVS